MEREVEVRQHDVHADFQCRDLIAHITNLISRLNLLTNIRGLRTFEVVLTHHVLGRNAFVG
jgi:hypothetical protein